MAGLCASLLHVLCQFIAFHGSCVMGTIAMRVLKYRHLWRYLTVVVMRFETECGIFSLLTC